YQGQGFGQTQYSGFEQNQGFEQPAQGFGQPDQVEQPAQGFGQPDQGMGGHTPPPGWANPSAPTDPFGQSGTTAPFGQDPFGGVSQPRQQVEPELKWWQK